MTVRTLPGVLAWVAAVWFCAVPAAGAQGGGVEGRLVNVERLIESSSGASRVGSSTVPAALGAREKARELHARAVKASAGGDPAAAARLLDEASRAMFEAVRLAASPDALVRKKERDFDTRRESLEALVDALSRIAVEKGREAQTQPVLARVTELAREAEDQRRSGRIDEGRARLDEAYDQATRAIDEMRSGDTLVRSLNFASKEEEYRYELGRNDTHRLLVEMLTREKRAQPGIERMVGTFVDKAVNLREQAQAQAAGGDYQGAVTTLEQSTKDYIRAIRSTGVYIPG